MKKKLLFFLTLALTICLSLFAVIPLQRADADNSDWMSRLDDSSALKSLSIPGTHNTAALYSLADVYGKCQTLNVDEQLKLGVRFVDIRLRLVDNELEVVHSRIDQKLDFADLLCGMVAFLQEHPSEFLFVSLKEDATPIRSDVDFVKTLEEQLLKYPDTVCNDTSLPETVGKARGKMHIFARYNNPTLGIPCGEGWINNEAFALGNIYIQDNYKVSTTEQKYSRIIDTFEISAMQEYDLVVNYASCYLSPSFPPVYAGLPAHDINNWLEEDIERLDAPLGVVLLDFITSELANLIIGRNFG